MGNSSKHPDIGGIHSNTTPASLKKAELDASLKFQPNLRLRTAEEIKQKRVSAYQYLIP